MIGTVDRDFYWPSGYMAHMSPLSRTSNARRRLRPLAPHHRPVPRLVPRRVRTRRPRRPGGLHTHVSTSSASSITFSSAILYGHVNPNGLATNYVFQYGTTSGYGGQTPLAPAGNGTISIKLSQSDLGPAAAARPTTTGSWRSTPRAHANGQDRTFKTASMPLSVQIAGVPNPVVFGNPFVVEGNLSGTGAANHEVVLQANPFPYLGGFHNVGNPELTNSVGGFSFPYRGPARQTPSCAWSRSASPKSRAPW